MGKSLWLHRVECKLFDSVFDEEWRIPRNKKAIKTKLQRAMAGDFSPKQLSEGYKLKGLSLFTTDLKGLIHTCKLLEEYYLGKEQAASYIRGLRKIGLVNDSGEITDFGHKLLFLLYYNDGELMREVREDNLSERFMLTVEFFLLLIINSKDDSLSKLLNTELLENLNLFFNNIPTGCSNIYSEIPDINFFYVLQAINYTGHEVMRFFELSNQKQNLFVNAMLKAIQTVPDSDPVIHGGKYKKLTIAESKYRRILRYYETQYQKDIRFRVKYSILAFALLKSIDRLNKCLYKEPGVRLFFPYSELKTLWDNFHLNSVYRLLTESWSHYKMELKLFNVDQFSKVSFDNNIVEEPLAVFKRRYFMTGQKIILVGPKNKVLGTVAYKIKNIACNWKTKTVYIHLVACNRLNVSLIEEQIKGGTW